MIVGDYVGPKETEEDCLESLSSLGLKYKDLFGVVISTKPAPSGLSGDVKFSISIKNLTTGVVTENLNSANFKIMPVTEDIRPAYEYVNNFNNMNIGKSRLK